MDNLSENLAKNTITLRRKQSLTQTELAYKAQIPRSSLTYIESGQGNPSLSNLYKISKALKVSIEELISELRPEIKHIKADEVPLKLKSKQKIYIQKLLPDHIPGMEIDKTTLAPETIMRGTPHLEKTKEYLYCESGKLTVHIKKEKFSINKGDVLAFPGDLPHSYSNRGNSKECSFFSVVVFDSN